jgi:hypothetical protein
MAEFSWAYIDSEAVLSSSGPTGSIQYRVADSGGNTSVSGSQNFVFHTASNLLAITGSVEISGTLTANQYNINVIDKTVTNISASGDTKFGDTDDDTHQFTGSMFINGPLSASSHISASAYYGDGSTLSNITATSISGAMGQFNTVTGLLITSGTMRLGDGGSDVAIIASQLTASQGALFNEQVMIVDDKNLVFGTGGDSVIKYDEASSDRLIVSGSSTGLFLGGGAVVVNSPNVTIQNDSSVIITGSLEITGSDDHLLVLHARDADVTRELVFRKDGTDAGSLYINSSEHIFLRSEVASKDIIFRTNSQNPLRIFGANHSVGIGGAASANGTLDVTGTSIVSGSLIVTGSVLNTTTTIDGTHVSSSLNISGSAFYGSGANLASLPVQVAGATTQIQFNNAGAFGATARATITAAASSAALVITGSVTITGSALNTTTTIDGTHISSSLNVSGSSFYGSGANLTDISAAPAGAAGQIQYNGGSALGASANATFGTTPGGVSQLSLTGSLQVVSGSTAVLHIDSSAPGLGAVRGRMAHHIRTGFSIAAGGTARTGRYVSIGGNAVTVSATANQVNCMITPFSGRLISVTYHFGSSAGQQNPALGQPQWEMRVGDVNALNGNTFAASFSAVGQVTASSWPGYRSVGGFDVQTKAGTLGGNNATGSFSFGTGSAVALFFQSGDATGNNTCGDAAITTVWEFDQLDPYISGSGN